MKLLTPAFVGLLVLLVAGLLVAGYVVKSLFASEEVVQEDPTSLVPMALAPMEAGTVITEAHIGRGPVRQSTMQDLPRTIARADRVLLGRIVKNRIDAATPIDTTDLYAPGERPPVNLTEGMRAVSITVNGGVQLLDRVIRDGDYVDVHFTPSVSDVRARGGFTMRLFEGVRLIQHQTARNGAAVTLEVTPEQANILILARERGDLQLAYTQSGPGNGTVAVADEDRAYLEEILGLKPMEKSDRFITEQIQGISYGTLLFEDDERVGLSRLNDDFRNGVYNGNGYNDNVGRRGGYYSTSTNGADRSAQAPAAGQTSSLLNRAANNRNQGGGEGSGPSNGAAGLNNRTIPTAF